VLFLVEIQKVVPKMVTDSNSEKNLPKKEPLMMRILRIGNGVKVRRARVHQRKGDGVGLLQ
jgi:hypothetical protein